MHIYTCTESARDFWAKCLVTARYNVDCSCISPQFFIRCEWILSTWIRLTQIPLQFLDATELICAAPWIGRATCIRTKTSLSEPERHIIHTSRPGTFKRNKTLTITYSSSSSEVDLANTRFPLQRVLILTTPLYFWSVLYKIILRGKISQSLDNAFHLSSNNIGTRATRASRVYGILTAIPYLFCRLLGTRIL